MKKLNTIPSSYLQEAEISVNLSNEGIRKLYETMLRDEALKDYTFPSKPSSDGYYHIYVADKTKKTGRRAVKAKTLNDLKNKVYEHEKGIHGRIKKTFRDAFELTQQEKMKLVKSGEKMISVQNTVKRNRSEYARYFGETSFEKKFVDEITKNDIESICYLNLTRYNLTPRAFMSMRSILRAVIKLSFNEYWINDNIYDRIDFNKYKDMLSKPAETAERVHSEENVERMLVFIHEHQRKYPKYLPSYALELQIAMGLRRGEVPPLMWKDIRDDLVTISREQLTVKKSEDNPKEYFQIVNHTKNHKNRVFPVTTGIKDILIRLKKSHELNGIESEYLFPAKSDNGVITNNTVYNFYRRMCNTLGIPIQKDLIKGTHSFRRNAITKVVNNTGGNVVLASQLFGNSPDVALKHYFTKADEEQARKALEA
ncbi:MAG: site-specific integrase [Lachnospiraceae bacterium]|nr:site-specific integrase [Lachnospiraceae bacterium]